jgi:hypothetical protein
MQVCDDAAAGESRRASLACKGLVICPQSPLESTTKALGTIAVDLKERYDRHNQLHEQIHRKSALSGSMRVPNQPRDLGAPQTSRMTTRIDHGASLLAISSGFECLEPIRIGLYMIQLIKILREPQARHQWSVVVTSTGHSYLERLTNMRALKAVLLG